VSFDDSAKIADDFGLLTNGDVDGNEIDIGQSPRDSYYELLYQGESSFRRDADGLRRLSLDGSLGVLEDEEGYKVLILLNKQRDTLDVVRDVITRSTHLLSDRWGFTQG
jgi:hypothetical protein